MLDRHRLEILDRDDCERLLGRHHLGRLAVNVGDQPIILPVSYALDGHDIVFHSDRGTKVHAAIGRPVAFEIDGTQAFDHGGWSVLVIGLAALVTDQAELERLAALPLPLWIAAEDPVWVRVRPTNVSGRRIPRP
jgi:nitroimidazol reductase NimA-like FMN-containing flavoprotein (pyridoxamine 5'-phosphate oxidase superfamily)